MNFGRHDAGVGHGNLLGSGTCVRHVESCLGAFLGGLGTSGIHYQDVELAFGDHLCAAEFLGAFQFRLAKFDGGHRFVQLSLGLPLLLVSPPGHELLAEPPGQFQFGLGRFHCQPEIGVLDLDQYVAFFHRVAQVQPEELGLDFAVFQIPDQSIGFGKRFDHPVHVGYDRGGSDWYQCSHQFQLGCNRVPADGSQIDLHRPGGVRR